ncbi:MAG: GNAT family N-acetyltransferase [Candidatus Sedimenticola sp. PURPLELP]
MSLESVEIRQANWPEDLPALRQVREEVFIREQGVPPDLEWDDDDPEAIHLLAEDTNKRPIGTVRLLPDGQIGRMAVVSSWRNRGIGGRLICHLLESTDKQRFPRLFLNAQTQAVSFYRRFGFAEQGEVFMEAGIPHLRMELTER